MTIYRHAAEASASRIAPPSPTRSRLLSTGSMRVFASTLVHSEVWHPICHEDCVRHSPVGATRNPMKTCEVATIRLAYELLYAGRRGSKCCFQSATRSRTERNRGEPSPLPDSSESLVFRAKPGRPLPGRRDLPEGWKRSSNRKSRRAIPVSRASIRSICLRAACRGAGIRIPARDGNLFGVCRSSGQTARIAAALLAQAEQYPAVSGRQYALSTLRPELSLAARSGTTAGARWWRS